MKLFRWFSYTVTMLKKRSFLDWFLNNVSALQIGMYNFSQTVLFSFLGGPFRQVGGLCHGCLRSWARAPRCSELYAQCQLSIFFLTVQNSVINSYRSVFSPRFNVNFFLLLLLLSASTLNFDRENLRRWWWWLFEGERKMCEKRWHKKKKNNKSAQ